MRSASFAICCGFVASAPVVHREAAYATESESNIVYAQGVYCHDNQCSSTHIVDLTLDLYKPYNADGPRPGVVAIHSGGYTGGDKKENAKACTIWASRGFVCITINYRLDQIRYTLDSGLTPANWSFSSPDPLPPSWQGGYRPSPRGVYAANRDAKAAVRWLRSQADSLNLDPNFIGAMGGSSGGQSVIGLASTFEWDFTTEMTASDDPTIGSIHADAGLSSSILAGVAWAGNPIVADEKIAHDGVPRWQSWNAPLALYRGTEDELMTQWGQDAIKERLDAAGVQCDLFPVPGASHETIFPDGRVDDTPVYDHSYSWMVKAMGLELAPAKETATITV